MYVCACPPSLLDQLAVDSPGPLALFQLNKNLWADLKSKAERKLLPLQKSASPAGFNTPVPGCQASPSGDREINKGVMLFCWSCTLVLMAHVLSIPLNKPGKNKDGQRWHHETWALLRGFCNLWWRGRNYTHRIGKQDPDPDQGWAAQNLQICILSRLKERKREGKRFNHCLTSPVKIVYSELCISAAAAAGLWHVRSLSLKSYTFHSIDWLLVNLSLSKNLHQCLHPPRSSGGRDWLNRSGVRRIRLGVPLRGALSRCCAETLACLRTYGPARAHTHQSTEETNVWI